MQYEWEPCGHQSTILKYHYWLFCLLAIRVALIWSTFLTFNNYYLTLCLARCSKCVSNVILSKLLCIEHLWYLINLYLVINVILKKILNALIEQYVLFCGVYLNINHYLDKTLPNIFLEVLFGLCIWASRLPKCAKLRHIYFARSLRINLSII